MADLNDLADFMDSFLQRNAAAYFADGLARRAAAAILQDLALHTPADVGDAVSNWQVTLDAPAPTIRPAFVPSPKGRVLSGVWVHAIPPAATILNNLPAILQAAKTALANKKPGQPIFITNNVEYIQLLEQGSSEQTPAGFVERARIIGQQDIQKSLSYLNVLNVTSTPAVPF